MVTFFFLTSSLLEFINKRTNLQKPPNSQVIKLLSQQWTETDATVSFITFPRRQRTKFYTLCLSKSVFSGWFFSPFLHFWTLSLWMVPDWRHESSVFLIKTANSQAKFVSAHSNSHTMPTQVQYSSPFWIRH